MRFLLFFSVFWTLLVLGFDAFIGVQLSRQVQAYSFHEAQGMIEHAEVTTYSGSKGRRTYGVDVRYTYTVNNQRYTGTKRSFAEWIRDRLGLPCPKSADSTAEDVPEGDVGTETSGQT